MITVYGITNCQTVIKARVWLEKNKIEYVFWDLKKEGIDKDHLELWCNALDWTTVLNRKGMMYRKANEDVQKSIIDQDSAIKFMLDVPTSIKRPVIEYGNKVIVGFDEERYTKLKSIFLQ
jgi:arsenate reductase (glutaredoxin)